MKIFRRYSSTGLSIVDWETSWKSTSLFILNVDQPGQIADIRSLIANPLYLQTIAMAQDFSPRTQKATLFCRAIYPTMTTFSKLQYRWVPWLATSRISKPSKSIEESAVTRLSPRRFKYHVCILEQAKQGTLLLHQKGWEDCVSKRAIPSWPKYTAT